MAYEVNFTWPANGFNTYEGSKLWRTAATLAFILSFLDILLGYFMLQQDSPMSNDVFYA